MASTMSVCELDAPGPTGASLPPQSEKAPAGVLHKLRKVVRAAALSWQIVGIALLWFAALNLFAWLLLGARDKNPAFVSTAMASLDTEDVELAKRFAEESARLNGGRVRGEMMRWEPYAYWRMRESRGSFINVGEDGLRRTLPAGQADASVPRVFLFGGSVMWGTGSRDEHTIPSYLAQFLSESGLEAEVLNLGQIGYVSTQELAAFEQCCRQQNVPTVALFFHGVNDVFSSIVNGEPGLTMHEMNREREFNLLNRNTPRPAAEALLRNLPIYRVLVPSSEPAQTVGQRAQQSMQRLVSRRASDPDLISKLDSSLVLRPLDPGESSNDRLLALVIEELMVGTAEWMKTNSAIATSLGAQFGTQVVDVWQPTVFSKAAPSPFEQQIIQQEVVLCTAFRAADRYIDGLSASSSQRPSPSLATNLPRIVTLAGVFDGSEWSGKTAYTDFCHLNEPANRAIARALLPLVLEALERSPQDMVASDADHM
ncbi:MAG: SGNH/GDSL hydrolase family protein [Pirellulales bacterium]|nr:SGNH/GDSL hydrolase family protein [Pirellulales bacterium]